MSIQWTEFRKTENTIDTYIFSGRKKSKEIAMEKVCLNPHHVSVVVEFFRSFAKPFPIRSDQQKNYKTKKKEKKKPETNSIDL